MTLLVGVDIQAVDEVELSIARFGDKYCRRLFTEHELEVSSSSAANIARSLAGKFAAKEAVMKLISHDGTVSPWRSIEIRGGTDRTSEVGLSGVAAALARQRGLEKFTLSISHCGKFATAAVVATTATFTDGTAS